MEAEETMECIQEFPEHHKMILDRLNEQREQDQFTDITLIVDGHHFKAHKAVLAACSQFFYKFFQDFTQEPLVEIEGVSNMAFRHLIEFTYTAKLMIQGEEEANDVWKAAEFLQMLEAIKALEVRNKENSSPLEENATTGKNEAKKRKIAETSNVITESLPSAESEPVEIEVEIAEGTIEVEDGLETLEEVASAEQSIKYIQSTGSSDDSALALLADITSKYRQGDRKGQIQEEDGCASDPTSKQVEGIEIVELQLSHVNNLFHCEKCNRSFKLFYHFKEHMKSHSTESFKCDICNKRYLRESAWKQHLTCYHLEEGGASKKQRPGKKIHVCQYCDKQFDHFGHFKEHLRKHTGEKPFECPNCHERFARNSTLKCHLTACQSGVGAKKGRKKLYECQVCNSVFNSWDQFKDHLVIHTGDKPNHCTLCDLWFMQGNELRRHLKEIHNISERIVTEEFLSVETVESEPVTSMTIIEQVGKVHVLPLLQVQVDSAQVTVEQVHADLLEDNQVQGTQVEELPEQVQVSYLEVGRIHTEEGTEVHVEELHVERVNQMQMEVQDDILEEADLDRGDPEIMDQGELEESKQSQADAAEANKEDHEQGEDLKTEPQW
ncbi:zinc finger protein 131 isoform X1 [Dromiciops gliroides]|uniref:zinc finger protein 131 isoform X1 n=2 Tax=Dromiciops gliroides TaxID=33562 RepID=UPI001CC34F33|nr:zinc finger protein 131 isoform X1 [Dromiciops gliroides]XP_043834787.1 zinc finger protein 131 isoform X1 [Dromiciops gliroides]XP_043834788.1 zinc finger protein 131 isoform X1 [Dromiciops gliroides]XP_043834789.1 zinc finger protein 131 isoform X1 [Dromiciops gliroides]XP_043834790.1 zinc finger protein 131 isoform X1 [Dromiciops gliroides]XP_043834791.1 zinc finger protein 131 isoform X1 [Dromiciops gliroides]